jgi:hypothetical protein
MGTCGSKCMQASTLEGNSFEDIKPKFDASGRRIMSSSPGNKKFPKAYTEHPQCLDCWMEQTCEENRAFISDTLEWKLKVGKYQPK